MRKVFNFLFTLCCTLLLAGCCSNKTRVDGNLLSHQQQIDRLEEELRNRDRTVEAAIRELGTITARSSAVEGTIDEVIELFAEYQRRVEQLIFDYNQIRAATEDNKEGALLVVPDTSYYDTGKNYRIYLICERHQSAKVAGYSFITLPFWGRSSIRYLKQVLGEVKEYGHRSDIVTYCPPLPGYKHVNRKSIGKFSLLGLFKPNKWHCIYGEGGWYEAD